MYSDMPQVKCFTSAIQSPDPVLYDPPIIIIIICNR
jgi:hypothetical protein